MQCLPDVFLKWANNRTVLGRGRHVSKRNMAAWLRFEKLPLSKPQDISKDIWNNILGQTRAKWRCFNVHHLIPAVKHHGAGVRI